MSPSALAEMTSDPRTGVVALYKSAQIVMEKDDFSNMLGALIRKLKTNVNKYYPDAGGILMGYQDIKLKRSTCEVTVTTLVHPVHIRAQFYLFKPEDGAELTCEVTKIEAARITCVAHGVFEVEVLSPHGCWDTVHVGQTVVVKVEAVEQMAWQEPRIVASLLQVIPLINIVEHLDEEENGTDSRMFEDEKNRDRMFRQSRQEKRKVEEVNPAASGEFLSPVRKRTRNASKSASVSSVTSPTLPSDNPNSKKQFPGVGQKHPSTPPPSPKGSLSSPAGTSTPKSKLFPSPVKKSPKKILPLILPKPASTTSSDDESDDEASMIEQNSGPIPSKPTVDGISETIQQASNLMPNDAPVPNLSTVEPPEKVSEPCLTPKTPRGKNSIPPGFTFKARSSKKGKPKLTAPDGAVHRTYKAAWRQWDDEHPNYLGEQSATPSLAMASPSGSDRSSPDQPSVVDGEERFGPLQVDQRIKVVLDQVDKPDTVWVSPVKEVEEVQNQLADMVMVRVDGMEGVMDTEKNRSKVEKKLRAEELEVRLDTQGLGTFFVGGTRIVFKGSKSKLAAEHKEIETQKLLTDQPPFSEYEPEPQSQSLLVLDDENNGGRYVLLLSNRDRQSQQDGGKGEVMKRKMSSQVSKESTVSSYDYIMESSSLGSQKIPGRKLGETASEKKVKETKKRKDPGFL